MDYDGPFLLNLVPISDRTEEKKNTRMMITRTAIREDDNSRQSCVPKYVHPHKTPRTWRHFDTERLKNALNLAPVMPRVPRVNFSSSVSNKQAILYTVRTQAVYGWANNISIYMQYIYVYIYLFIGFQIRAQQIAYKRIWNVYIPCSIVGIE